MGTVDTWRDSHPAYAGAPEADWLEARRATALAAFEATGFPGARDEAWKYTNTRGLAKTPFRHAPGAVSDLADRLAPLRIAHASAELVFVNGALAAELSVLPDGAAVVPLTRAVSSDADLVQAQLGASAADDEAFTALNSAFLQDGVLIRLEGELEGPIHLLTVADVGDTPVVTHLRHLIVASPHAKGTIVETHAGWGEAAALVNVVTEIQVGAGASVEHHLLEAVGSNTHVATMRVRQDRDSRFTSHVAVLGGGVVRNDLRVILGGPGAEATLNGLYVLGGTQHVDNHTVIDHAAPHCNSHENYKGVLGGKSKGIFDGLVMVREGARKTDSVQNNRNLVLTPTADANSKPTLEIYNDDVKCAHGSTIGRLDQGQLAYLRMRGIPKDEASKILTRAFVADVVGSVADPKLRERLEERVSAGLTRVQEGTS